MHVRVMRDALRPPPVQKAADDGSVEAGMRAPPYAHAVRQRLIT